MEPDRTVLQTRKLLAESHAIMARLKSVRDDMEEARGCAEQAVSVSRPVVADAYEKLADSPPIDRDGQQETKRPAKPP
jgi:hypothetical protein